MFGSQILDIAIAMILFFLFISLICSAIREGIEGVMKTRALNIERAMREMLNDPSGATVTKSLFDHPLISSLFKGQYDPSNIGKGLFRCNNKFFKPENLARWARKDLPSYIPASSFASALLDITANGAVGDIPNAQPQGPLLSLDAVRCSIASLPNATLQRAVLNAADRANGDLAQAQKNLEDWFNTTMDRVSGWYKRRTQLILFALGFAAAVALNLDTFAALDVVSADKSIRDGLVAVADKVKTDQTNADQMKELANDFQQLNLPFGWTIANEGNFKTDAPASYKDWTYWNYIQNLKPLPQAKAKCASTAPAADTCFKSVSFGAFLKMLLGWLITGAAVTLGAPFWFDTLSKFMTVRSALKPLDPAQSQTTDTPTSTVVIAPTTSPIFEPHEWNVPGIAAQAGDI